MVGTNGGGGSGSSTNNQQGADSQSSPMHLSYSRQTLAGTKRKYLEAAIEGNQKMIEDTRKALKIDDEAAKTAKNVHKELEKKLEQSTIKHQEAGCEVEQLSLELAESKRALEKLVLIKHSNERQIKSIEDYGEIVSTMLKAMVASMPCTNEDTN